MDDLTELIEWIRRGGSEAFSPVVERFQDMAVGYAYAILGDFHQAEDAAQNAFLTAYLNLESVEDPKAFPGWMRRIVFTECTRMTRKKKASTVDVEAVEIASDAERPDTSVVSAETQSAANEKIAALPDRSREAVVLYYLAEMSQKEIGDFLGASEGTIKKRLHDARERMRKGVESVAKGALKQHQPSRDHGFSERVVATVATAILAIGEGDCDRLMALLEAHPAIVNVGGAIDFRYADTSYFYGATLLHFLAGHPTTFNELPDNALEVMEV